MLIKNFKVFSSKNNEFVCEKLCAKSATGEPDQLKNLGYNNMM